MDLLQILPILGIGSVLGGLAGAFFQSRFQHQKQLKEWEHELKKKRYLSMNIFFLTKIDVEKGLPFLKNIRPDILTEVQLDKEIEVEFFNSLLFSSEKVINACTQFIKEPSYVEYCNVVFAMRKDLWGHKKVPRFTWDSITYVLSNEK